MSMSNISCPFCNGKSNLYLSQKDINRDTTEHLFHLYKCTSCGLLFISNPPKDLGPYYVQDYHALPQNKENLNLALKSQQPKLEILKQYKSSGDLLEIGSSVGYFSALAKDAGFNVTAIEYDRFCVDFMKSNFGINAIQSQDPSAIMSKMDQQFDAICLWHSIEHIKDPWITLEACAKLLKSNGVLLIAAPNPNSRQALLMGKYWPHHDLPRHLYGLPMDWLEKLMKKAGLTVALKTTTDPESIYWNRFSWAMISKSFVKSAPARVQNGFWRLGLFVGKFFSLWEDKADHGSCYVMIFKKV